jgi:hypothetical protein
MNLEEKILSELNITEDVLNIYPHGSRVYGCHNESSDYDYIIVMKSSMLTSGVFKQNAISNKDKTIQGIVYSRSGFIDAINNYEISALECLSLPDEMVIKKKWNFKIQKWNDKDFIRAIISKVSASWFSADNNSKDGFKDIAKKGLFHSIRILIFAQQLLTDKKVFDFSVANYFKNELDSINEDYLDLRKFIPLRDELINKLKNGNSTSSID